MSTSDTNLNLDNLNLGSEFEDALQNSLPIPEGRYIAVVKGVELKHNQEKGSVGWLWKLGINTSNEDLSEWDTAARVHSLNYYTFLGKMIDGQLTYGEKGPGFSAVNILKALGVQGGKLDPKAVIGRQILVTVAGKPSWSEIQNGVKEEDAELELTVVGTRKFIQDGEIAPRLSGFEALDAQEYVGNQDSEDEPF